VDVRLTETDGEDEVVIVKAEGRARRPERRRS
jgi:hypothetical protein